MGGLLKMMEGFDFSHQNPMAEIQVPMNSIFPTVLAMISESMAQNLQGNALKSKQLWDDTKAYVSKTEKSTNPTQKPDKQEVARSDKETSTYALVYYNPETKQSEVVEGSVSINYEDETEQAIEEGLGQRSTYGMYSLVASQLIREEINEQKMQEIMERIKFESPDPFGGGTAIKVNYEGLSPKLLEQYGDQIIALELAEKKKGELVDRMAAQIRLVDELVKNLGKQDSDARKLVAKLPPLSRERMLALFRKKRISKKIVKELLLKDEMFLAAAKEKMGAMRIQDILKVVMKIKPENRGKIKS